MRGTLKRNALLTLLFSGVFYMFFMHVKHAPGLASINPFAVDPYDATGSLALILSALLAPAGVLCAFFPSSARMADEMQSRYIFRIQVCVPLAILVYLASAAVALARHFDDWYPDPQGTLLLLESVGMLVLTLVMLALVLGPATTRLSDLRLRWHRPVSVIAISVVLLVAYPDGQDRGLIAALLAIIAGVLFLNCCLRALVLWLFPYTRSELEPMPITRSRARKAIFRFTLAIVTGLFIGAVILLSEMAEGPSGPHVSRILLVAVFLGAGVFNIAVSYVFLGTLLGIRRP